MLMLTSMVVKTSRRGLSSAGPMTSLSMSKMRTIVGYSHSACDVDLAWSDELSEAYVISISHTALFLTQSTLWKSQAIAYQYLEKSSEYKIAFGQTLEVKDKKYTVTDDAASPRYGIGFRTDVGGSLEIHQKFTGGADKSFTTKWYDAGTDVNKITWDLYFNVWFKSTSNDKFLVKFANTTSQIIYYDLEGEWSLAGPNTFAAGKVPPRLSKSDST